MILILLSVRKKRILSSPFVCCTQKNSSDPLSHHLHSSLFLSLHIDGVDVDDAAPEAVDPMDPIDPDIVVAVV